MLSKNSSIAVTSRSFSKNEELKRKLKSHFSNVKFNDSGANFSDDDLIKFLQNCEGAIVSEDNLNREVIEQLPHLKVVSKFGVGTDTIDMKYLKKKNIKFHWKPGLNSTSVAELTIGFLILTLRGAITANRKMLKGDWVKPTFSKELSEIKLGLIGYGNVGKKIADFLQVHKTKILVHDPYLKKDLILPKNLSRVTFKKILKDSDVVSLHLPLNSKTKNLIKKEEIDYMKKGAILLNLSRGGIVEENALIDALKKKKIAAAAFDVFDKEPKFNKKLVNLDNFFSTPHIAGTSSSSTLKLGISAIEGLALNSKNG